MSVLPPEWGEAAVEFRRDRDQGNVAVPNGKGNIRFGLIPFADLHPLESAAYLIKGLFPRTGLAVIWGEPKCGKSFWMMDTAMHVALGWTYRGRRVVQGGVVYLALEGAVGYGQRAEAFRRHHFRGQELSPPFFLMPVRTDLVADHTALVADIRRQIAAPVMVVIDTLNRSLRGSESNDADMANYVRAADAVREAFDCLVPIVHHCGLASDRPRGHTSLTGAADAQLSVRRDDAENILVEVEYCKDGPEGAKIVSRLETVEVGVDEDGDPITSCVVVPVDGEDASAKRAPRIKLTDKQKRFLDIIVKAIDHTPADLAGTSDVPQGLKAVTRIDLRRHLVRDGFVEPKPENNVRAVLSNGINALAGKGVIGASFDHVWVVPQ